MHKVIMSFNTTYLNKHFYNAGIAIALLILLAIGILTFRFLQLTIEYSNRVVHTHLVIEHLQALLTHLVDAETGERGYIITGDYEYLKPYHDALEHIDSQMAQLKHLTNDDPAQQKRLDNIQPLIDRKLAELALSIKLRQSGKSDSARAMVKKNISTATMDSIRTYVVNARNQEFSLLNERTRNHQMYIQRLDLVLLFGGLSAIVILLVVIIFLRIENTRRTRVEKELMSQKEHLNDLVDERTKAVMASEQRWATTLVNLTDAVIVTDETGKVVFMNIAAESITGYSEKDTVDKPLFEAFNIMSAGSRQLVDNLVARVLSEGVVTDLADHTILVRKDGKEIPIEGNASRIQQEDGTPTGIVVVFRDVTRQRQADEALRYQAAILNFAHDAIFVFNAENTITFWSRGAEETYGWSPEEAVGRAMYDLLQTRFPIPLAEIKREAETTGEWNGELVQTRKDGEVIVVMSRWTVQRDIWGQYLSTLEINRDITGRKQAEDALRYERERLLTILDNMNIGVILLDSKGTFLTFNKAALEWYGFSRESEMGEHPADYIADFELRDSEDTFIPLDRWPVLRAVNGEYVQDYEVKLTRTSTGDSRWISFTTVPILDSNGGVIHILMSLFDITERKKADAALHKSERNLEDAQRIAHVGSWVWNVQTSEISCTAETFRIYGEEPFSFQPKTDIFLTYVHPEDRERVRDTIRNVQAGRICGIDHEFRIVRKDASVRCIHSIGETMECNAAGKPHLLRGTGQDITERKQAEEALKDSESRLRLVQQVAHIGSFEYDIIHNVSAWSPEMEALHGLNRGTYSGNFQQWRAFVHPDDLPGVDQLLNEAMKTGHFETEWRIVRTDGKIRWMSARGKVFIDTNGKPIRMVGVNLDITERRQAEELVRLSEQRYRYLFDTMNEGYCRVEVLFDKKGRPFDYRFVEVNNAFEAQAGLSQATGKSMRELVSEIEDYWFEFYGRIVTTGNPEHFVNQVKALGRWFDVRAFRIGGEESRQIAIFFNDITQRHQAEEALLQRTEELAATNRDLEAFSYSVSHDLRNPLKAIGSFADFLMEDYAESLDEEGQDYLLRINSGVKKMNSLIDDMLSLSRIGRQEMKIVKVDLSAIARNYLGELANAEPQRKTEIVVQDNVRANADPRLIHLALENLLRNAWKFTSKKEVTRIEFGTLPSTSLRHRPSEALRPGETNARWPSEVEAQTVYFIKDNGAGFDMQFARKIFEPFKRVHAQNEFGGTGVGLSIVQRVIGRHGGKVWAEGQEGMGATFYFTLG